VTPLSGIKIPITSKHPPGGGSAWPRKRFTKIVIIGGKVSNNLAQICDRIFKTAAKFVSTVDLNNRSEVAGAASSSAKPGVE
jgi:hypothetical protein